MMQNANLLRGEIEKLNKLPGHRATRIRNAYYKAIEGLQSLIENTEFADLEIAGSEGTDGGGPLIDEHLLCCEAMEILNKLKIGKVL